MENVLEKLFESVPKVRMLRLFMRSPDGLFTFQEITERSGLRRDLARRELGKLLRLGLVRKKTAWLQYEVKRKRRGRKKIQPKVVIKSKRAEVYFVNPDFKILSELRDLVVKSAVTSRPKLLRKIKGLGKVKLAVLSGIFINSDRSRTDLLLVGNGIKNSRLEKFLSVVESELGRPLHYTLMTTDEFKYRLDMYDRFLRDILEYPHEKLINKLGV